MMVIYLKGSMEGNIFSMIEFGRNFSGLVKYFMHKTSHQNPKVFSLFGFIPMGNIKYSFKMR